MNICTLAISPQAPLVSTFHFTDRAKRKENNTNASAQNSEKYEKINNDFQKPNSIESHGNNLPNSHYMEQTRKKEFKAFVMTQ